jgi:hypothetical protein
LIRHRQGGERPRKPNIERAAIFVNNVLPPLDLAD